MKNHYPGWVIRRGMKEAIRGRALVSMADILDGLGVVNDANPRATASHIGTLMAQSGWKRVIRKIDGERKIVYLRPTWGEAVEARNRTRKVNVKAHLADRIRQRRDR